MSLIKDGIEEHISKNNEEMETQAGFTKGGKIEDNIYLLKYCVEDSIKRKVPLYVASIDYSKAFDSIDRHEMIDAMIKYKIHPKIIDAVASIYEGDTTSVELNEGINEEIEVTSGIRQGCTGSTVFFKLITYLISKQIQETRAGFRNDKFYMPILFFADDGLMLANTEEEMVLLMQTLIRASRACGLEVNKEKSSMLIFNHSSPPQELEGIKVKEQIKYLGIIVDGKKDMFHSQKKIMIEKAQKMANMTFGIIARSCNKLLIGKTYWKNLALPAILYGTNIIDLQEKDVRKLQTIENGVFRQLLGAPKYAPVSTLRGEVGASEMKTRIMSGQLQFLRGGMQGGNQLLKEVMKEKLKKQERKKSPNILKYMDELKMNENDIKNISKVELKKKLEEWDTRRWKEEMNSKTSISIYKRSKSSIQEDKIYDNTPASRILFQARSNTLPLNIRKRFKQEPTGCELCPDKEEDMEHFLLYCPAMKDIRQHSLILQQPYKENNEETMQYFLFDKTKNRETNKEVLYQMWKLRNTELEKVRDQFKSTPIPKPMPKPDLKVKSD